MSSRLLKLLETAVIRSLLLRSSDQEIANFLDQNPTVGDPADLPEGRVKRIILRFCDQHIHVADPTQGPSIEQALENRPPRPPSVVDVFLAALLIQQGLRSECIRIAATTFFPTDCYEPSFPEIWETLRMLHWTSVGSVHSTVLSAVPFLATLAHLLGARIRMPRDFWAGPEPSPDAPLRFAASLRTRSHVEAGSLLADLRRFPCPVASASHWILGRPLLVAGVGTAGLSTVGASLLGALSAVRARAGSFRLHAPSPRAFLDGLACRPGLVSIVDSTPSASDPDSSDPDPGTDSDEGNVCQDYPISSSSENEHI